MVGSTKYSYKWYKVQNTATYIIKYKIQLCIIEYMKYIYVS